MFYLKKSQFQSVNSTSGGTPARTGILRKIIAALVKSWQRRRTIMVLDSLNDQLLADIGIRRAEIPQVVDAMLQNRAKIAPSQPLVAPLETPRDHLRQAA
ncbi:DUF1127 domain-containing protein [Limibacillus halophilus]|uniref:Uncharacterized protein YjiS (DUF1127 family) n=1 Tax=Limibacillus halophilus TaxID=1579333 RepID=A0A839SN51_9PROT|nr:DUF1127 domain-containing protein [Limibacillus halophilus]MBB3064327.1 uncharacterized protein YjiS (DUF1127 family) [Limibacillus halophilus]